MWPVVNLDNIYDLLLLLIRCVVWTGDGRVFFYNPSQRSSLWERPDDLVGRTDVDKMVQTPPEVATPGMMFFF